MRRFYLIFIIYLITVNQIKSIEIDSIYIGDYLEITTQRQHNKDSIVSIMPQNIEIIEFKIDTVKKEQNKIYNKITITSYDSGIYIMNQAQSSIIFNTDTIKVNYLNIDMSKDIKDITKIKNYNYSVKDYITISLPYLIIISIIIFLLTLFTKTESKNKITKEKIKKIPPHEKAMTELEKLESSNLIENEKYKIFYSLLSDILRKYIEEKFIIQAMENPTHEIIKNINKKTNKENTRLIKKILQITDLVKYAKATSNKKESQDIIKISYDFITNTINE